MSVAIKFGEEYDREKIISGQTDQFIQLYNPENYSRILKSRDFLSVFHKEEYLFDAMLETIFRLRFFRRITPRPYVVDSNSYMMMSDLKVLATRNGFKDHKQFYSTMSRMYGNYLAKETFVVIRFKKVDTNAST